MLSRNELEKLIIDYGRLMGEKNFTPGYSGNISCRFEEGMLITTSGSSNGYLRPEEIVYTDFTGKSMEDGKKPSSEKLLHIEFYKIWLYSGTSDTEAVNKVSTDVDPEINTTADGCSGYQPRENASYTLSNIESGLYWVARVRAYADTSPADGSSSGLVMVAEAVSNAQAVFGNDDSISVSLNELGTSDSSIGQVEKAGKIAITLKLPNGSDGASITCNAIPLSGTAAGEISVPVSDTVTLSAENTFTFTISEYTFENGNYLLTDSF